MISDEDIKRLFMNGQAVLAKHFNPAEPLYTQFYRGVMPHVWDDQHPGGCVRHMAIFKRFNIIPKYCFDCYKVVVEPRTVVELFKLMVVFERMRLPNDNTRKCLVEGRPEVDGTYKGIIYCRGEREGVSLLELTREKVRAEISGEVPVFLKRGCSEYGLSYPEFARTDPDTNKMEYKPEWEEYEARGDRELDIDTNHPPVDTYNTPAYSLQDAKVMLAWLRYAATIGDSSYLKISGRILPPFPNIKRPQPFRGPKEDE